MSELIHRVPVRHWRWIATIKCDHEGCAATISSKKYKDKGDAEDWADEFVCDAEGWGTVLKQTAEERRMHGDNSGEFQTMNFCPEHKEAELERIRREAAAECLALGRPQVPPEWNGLRCACPGFGLWGQCDAGYCPWQKDWEEIEQDEKCIVEEFCAARGDEEAQERIRERIRITGR